MKLLTECLIYMSHMKKFSATLFLVLVCGVRLGNLDLSYWMLGEGLKDWETKKWGRKNYCGKVLDGQASAGHEWSGSEVTPPKSCQETKRLPVCFLGGTGQHFMFGLIVRNSFVWL